MSGTKYHGTIKPTANYNPQGDASRLKSAMKGLGTNEQLIIETLPKRTDAERQALCAFYKTMHGEDLREELDSELGGDLKTIIHDMMLPLAEFEAEELSRAMKGLGTDDDLLVEILGTRTNAQIQQIVNSYKKIHDTNLEDSIRSETSGDFERLLVSLTTAGRLEKEPADPARARADAEALYKAGEKCFGTDESTFRQIFTLRSFAHLKLVCDEYDKLSDKTLEEAIESEMSGDLKTGMLTLVKSARNRPAYFAEKLYKAMKGLGTDEKTVFRVIITRSEVDMVKIKREFQNNYEKTLEEFISDDFSGDGKNILLAMID